MFHTSIVLHFAFDDKQPTAIASVQQSVRDMATKLNLLNLVAG